jgi:hypothetical protein
MLYIVKYLRSYLDLAIVLSRTNKLRFYAYTDGRIRIRVKAEFISPTKNNSKI